MLNQLRQVRDEISMEVHATDPAPTTISTKLSSLLDQAGEFLTKNILQRIGNVFAGKDLAWLSGNANRRPYSDMRGIQLVAPQGFKGTLVDYGRHLVKTAEEVEDLDKQVLTPFHSWLSNALSDPASVRSLTNNLKIPGLQHLDYASQQKRLDAFFPEKADLKQPIYGELIQRQGDWTELSNLSKKLSTIYASGKFEAVQRKLPDVSHLLGTLAARLTEEGSEYQFSTIQVDALSKVTYQIAEQIEFYGVLRHRVDEYLRTLEANVEIVKKEF